MPLLLNYQLRSEVCRQQLLLPTRRFWLLAMLLVQLVPPQCSEVGRCGCGCLLVLPRELLDERGLADEDLGRRQGGCQGGVA